MYKIKLFSLLAAFTGGIKGNTCDMSNLKDVISSVEESSPYANWESFAEDGDGDGSFNTSSGPLLGSSSISLSGDVKKVSGGRNSNTPPCTRADGLIRLDPPSGTLSRKNLKTQSSLSDSTRSVRSLQHQQSSSSPSTYPSSAIILPPPPSSSTVSSSSHIQSQESVDRFVDPFDETPSFNANVNTNTSRFATNGFDDGIDFSKAKFDDIGDDRCHSASIVSSSVGPIYTNARSNGQVSTGMGIPSVNVSSIPSIGRQPQIPLNNSIARGLSNSNPTMNVSATFDSHFCGQNQGFGSSTQQYQQQYQTHCQPLNQQQSNAARNTMPTSSGFVGNTATTVSMFGSDGFNSSKKMADDRQLSNNGNNSISNNCSITTATSTVAGAKVPETDVFGVTPFLHSKFEELTVSGSENSIPFHPKATSSSDCGPSLNSSLPTTSAIESAGSTTLGNTSASSSADFEGRFEPQFDSRFDAFNDTSGSLANGQMSSKMTDSSYVSNGSGAGNLSDISGNFSGFDDSRNSGFANTSGFSMNKSPGLQNDTSGTTRTANVSKISMNESSRSDDRYAVFSEINSMTSSIFDRMDLKSPSSSSVGDSSTIGSSGGGGANPNYTGLNSINESFGENRESSSVGNGHSHGHNPYAISPNFGSASHMNRSANNTPITQLSGTMGAASSNSIALSGSTAKYGSPFEPVNSTSDTASPFERIVDSPYDRSSVCSPGLSKSGRSTAVSQKSSTDPFELSIFADLDPLGLGKTKPIVDKTEFFQVSITIRLSNICISEFY